MNTFSIINRIKHFFVGNIVFYEALGQVILPLGLSDLRQYHLPSGFINHNIAHKEVFYSENKGRGPSARVLYLEGIFAIESPIKSKQK